MPTLHNSMPRPAVHPFRFSASDIDHDPPHVPPVTDMTSGASHYSPERTRYQPRRMSALAYQSPDTRDRDRRSSRHVVVVIPPPDLPLDRGPLGNVLSIGPRHRLSQGILMPLFPSMFGQLNAIAREYNFPSIVGICLYLHINESGKTMTPRISDDTWQYLFGHLSDSRPPSGEQLPICGSIEFDIDLNKARWFDAWASGNLRDPNQVSLPAATPLSSEAHRRGESQATNVDEQPVESRLSTSISHTVVASSRPETLRHLPKKLSLVDKFELHGVHLPSKLPDYPDHPASSPTHGTYASSPILQPVNPETTETDLEHRVNSWRTTTDLHPLPDVEVPVGLTGTDEYALEHNFGQAVNIDDFPWSVTSEGPRSPTLESLITSPRLSSIHLDRRVNGSVPLTPTTVTSWGPMDDEWHSVVSNVTRLPSPDIGERVIEDAMAPRHRAVWGNSFGWRSATTWKQVYPYSPFQMKPAIQVHLQDIVPRYPTLVIYPPTVPQLVDPSNTHTWSSAKSVWGNSFGWERTVSWRKTYPYSMVTIQPLAIQLRSSGGLQFRYPSLHIYPTVYPYLEIYPTRDEDVSQPVSVILNKPGSFLAHYPSLVIYPAVYPHLDIYPQAIKGSQNEAWSQPNTHTNPLNSPSLYPNLIIYPAVYPYFNLYPNTLQVSDTLKQEIDVELVNAGRLTAEYPNMAIYPGAYSCSETYPTKDMRQASGTAWGVSFGWLTAKTWVQVYPLHTATPLATRQRVDNQSIFISKSRSADIVVDKQAVWGSSFGWEIAATWRAVWPTSHVQSPLNTSPISVQLEHSRLNYPYLVIYPPIYPHLDIYPQASVASVYEFLPTKGNEFTVDPLAHYPNLVIYPVVYPHFSLYPASAGTLASAETERGETTTQVGPIELPTSKLSLEGGKQYSETNSIECLPSSLDLDLRVPDDIKITFPHQPWDMVWPFFRHVDQVETISSVFKQSVPEYPHPVNHQQAHPTLANVPVSENEVPDAFAKLNVYPSLDIYPVAYPHFNIYPAIDIQVEDCNMIVSNILHERVDVTLASVYPNLDIYPACYPYNLDNIYPFINTTEPTQTSHYPWLDIYPPVYPSVSDSLYLPGTLDEAEYNSVSASQQVQDSYVNDLTPPPYVHSTTWGQQKTRVKLRATVLIPFGKRPARNPKTHLELHTEVFQDGVVWSPSGYSQDLSSLMTKRIPGVPVPESLPPYPRDAFIGSRSGSTTSPTRDRPLYPLVHPPVLPPLRVRSPGVPSQPHLAVSETPVPRLPSPTNTYTHMRTTSARFSQAVKSMMPRGQRRNSGVAPGSPTDDHKERAKSPTRLLSLVERRPTITPPHTHTSEFLTRAPRSPQPKESFVLQRARAYEQATAVNPSSGVTGTGGTHAPFVIPSFSEMYCMSGVADAIEKSKITP